MVFWVKNRQMTATSYVGVMLFLRRSSVIDREGDCIMLLLSMILDSHAQRLVLHLCAGIKFKAWVDCSYVFEYRLQPFSRFCCILVMCR